MHKSLRFGSGRAWFIWSLTVLFVLYFFNIQTGYAVMAPLIEKSLALSVSQIGVVGATYTFAFAIVQFASGTFLDKFGLKRTMPWAVMLVTLGALIYSMASNALMLSLAQVVLAIGASFGFIGAGFASRRWFPAAKYGLLFGMVQGIESFGGAVSQPLLAFIAKYYDWRYILGGFFVFGVFLTAAFFIWVRDPNEKSFSSKLDGERIFGEVYGEILTCLKIPEVVLVALISGASFGVMIAVGTLWGPRLIDAHGYQGGIMATAVAWLGQAVGSPVLNIWSNRVKGRKVPLLVSVFCQLIVILMIIYMPAVTDPVIVFLMFLLGFFSATNMLCFAIAGDIVPLKLIGSASAIINAASFIVGGVAIMIPSLLLKEQFDPSLGGFQKALVIMPLCLAIGLILSFFVKETFQKEKETGKREEEELMGNLAGMIPGEGQAL